MEAQEEQKPKRGLRFSRTLIFEKRRWISFGIGILYALLARFIFGLKLVAELSTLSTSFLVVVPFALGALIVYFAPSHIRHSWGESIVAPIFPGMLFLLGVIVFGIEASVCIIMATPIFMAANSFGGLVMHFLLRLFSREGKKKQTETYAIALMLMLPYLAAPIESQFTVQDSIRTIQTQIIIKATPETIWKTIVRVPEIQESEHRLSFYQIVGLPRPVEAMLSYDGMGGMRSANYNNGLRFIEKITAWEVNHKVSFTIDPDPAAAIPEPYNMLDSAMFEIIEGTYIIEPREDGTCVLHLISHERVTTHFNAYSGWWSDILMTDLQNYILEIVKNRAEKAQLGN